MSWLRLANKTAIVTGAGSGIGAVVAKALSQEACQVVLADVDESRLQAVQQECGPVARSIVCDISKEDQVRHLFQSSPESSILINCAGITRDGWIGKMDVATQWQSVLDVNLTGTFMCCREFLNQNILSEGGAIVNVSSVVALQGNLGQTNYAASKGGVWSFTKALAKEVAHRNVRVNCVCPGFIETPMVQLVPEKVQDQVKQKIALGKFGRPEDVANLILFLASCERSGYITGEAIECSGLLSL
jgi:NAD(P)-dependent dehydrogenase (short-subunit alcohol dehydrogenase family)